VNAWIQSTAPITVEGTQFAADNADIVVDFSGAVDDATNAGYMLPQYAFDLSHPNTAGQAAEAATIPVSQL
jgi:dihydroxyacetone kinase